MTLSDRIRHEFHVISNVRPIVWICIYVGIIPVFAFFYWLLPEGAFRIPDGGGTDYGSWIYYSIVTITTLGFGEYTPAMPWSQALTAAEVFLGMLSIGFFLNAVGSMKSEIDVASEIEKQRIAHQAAETQKLQRNIPIILYKLNTFLAYCYAVTTPFARRQTADSADYNPHFTYADMADLFKPSELPIDHTGTSAVAGLFRCSDDTAIYLDLLQGRVDLTLWPAVLDDVFKFVANWQLFASADEIKRYLLDKAANTDLDVHGAEQEISAKIAAIPADIGKKDIHAKNLDHLAELYHYIKENAGLARQLETLLTQLKK